MDGSTQWNPPGSRALEQIVGPMLICLFLPLSLSHAIIWFLVIGITSNNTGDPNEVLFHHSLGLLQQQNRGRDKDDGEKEQMRCRSDCLVCVGL